jgi:hypothetical protein
MSEFASNFDSKQKEFESLVNQLSNYKSSSEKGNDQIDNSIFSLEEIKNNIGESLDKANIIIKNLESYKQEGRKENK